MASTLQDIKVVVDQASTRKRDLIVIPAAQQSTAAHCATRIPGHYDYCIIDPASTEFNRGG